MKALNSPFYYKIIILVAAAIYCCNSIVIAAPLPIVTIAPQQSGTEPSGTLKYGFFRTGGDPSQPLYVHFMRKPQSTATPWSDFNHPGSGTIIFPPWASNQELEIEILDDHEYEAKELLILQGYETMPMD